MFASVFAFGSAFCHRESISRALSSIFPIFGNARESWRIAAPAMGASPSAACGFAIHSDTNCAHPSRARNFGG